MTPHLGQVSSSPDNLNSGTRFHTPIISRRNPYNNHIDVSSIRVYHTIIETLHLHIRAFQRVCKSYTVLGLPPARAFTLLSYYDNNN
jgi:hypothetical protein